MKEAILTNRAHAHEHGMDAPEVTNWRWDPGLSLADDRGLAA
jgi:xylulose-5-phosphate/fructose-6-phosphate phosphoketolase